ncbi:MAG: MoaF N-terminal domain-containing protein [Lachnospiraceae bacterium]|nr:MoaF N-terminal domain-containing protein [Lachnospiraceae bacterium]MBQ1399489.1 MoaF N-terminal domain-containing protein [Lachnospiraceae bacterium]MBQ4308966.1 MoaF N-terminal domain-containing protein [Lachnospiraceae bacterium]
MDLTKYERPFYSINQFHSAHVTELKGKKFKFVMDGGYDYYLNFIGEDTLTWAIDDAEPVEAVYECLKGDDTTYIMDFDVVSTLGTDHRQNETFVIDLEQRLVTRLLCTVGYNKRLPFLVKSEFDFGAIDIEGRELPFRRHCWSSEMLGTRVEWHWSEDMWTHHKYYDAHFYTLTWPENSSAVANIGDPFEVLPSHDEVAFYVKIKENMYLFVLTEELMERTLQGGVFRSNNMAFLQNYDRMYHAGRTFGSINMDGKIVPCRTLFGAFGAPLVLRDELLYSDNAYTV